MLKFAYIKTYQMIHRYFCNDEKHLINQIAEFRLIEHFVNSEFDNYLKPVD